MQGLVERFYPESRFGGFTDVDGTIAFYGRINALVLPHHVVLDVGCGRGVRGEDPIPYRRGLSNLRGKVRAVIGLDVDRAGESNPLLDEFRLISGPTWPVETSSADFLICDHVLEHIEDPGGFMAEASRALRPGGFIAIRTPNRWSYVAISSRLVPSRYHARVTSKVQDSRREEDVFPTLYRCNTARAVRRCFRQHAFEGVAYGYEAEPSYLSFSAIAYWLGTLHQAFAPAFLRPSIFAFAVCRKR